MAETWREGGADMLAQDVAELTGMGCAMVLVTGTGTAGKGQGNGDAATISNTLYDESGLLETFSWPHLAGRFVGAGSTMSAALAAMLAQGLDPAAAVRAAQEYAHGALANAQRFGMGKLVPNKFFRSAGPGALHAKP
jgi:hydroxymethylpyrimidine/phosphomethylpyrimidine kinase